MLMALVAESRVVRFLMASLPAVTLRCWAVGIFAVNQCFRSSKKRVPRRAASASRFKSPAVR